MISAGWTIFFIVWGMVVFVGLALDWLRGKRPGSLGDERASRHRHESRPGNAAIDDDKKRAELRSVNDPAMNRGIDDAKKKADLSHAKEPPVSLSRNKAEIVAEASPIEVSSRMAATAQKEKKPTEECPRCGGLHRYNAARFARIIGDEYGYLYQCPVCLKYWYYDTTYAKTSPASEEWIKNLWPDLKL